MARVVQITEEELDYLRLKKVEVPDPKPNFIDPLAEEGMELNSD